jgi:hypothetical protein
MVPLPSNNYRHSYIRVNLSVSGGTVGTCCRDLVFHTPCSAMDNFYVFADLSWTSRSHCTYPPPKIVSSRSIETQGGGISQVLSLSRTVISNTWTHDSKGTQALLFSASRKSSAQANAKTSSALREQAAATQLLQKLSPAEETLPGPSGRTGSLSLRPTPGLGPVLVTWFFICM